MGFASGTVSFRRYHVEGSHPKVIDKDCLVRISEHAFGTSEAVTSDGIESGWIAPTHVLDTNLTIEKVSVGEMLHLALRLDRTSAPANVVRAYRQIEEQAALEASGKEFLSKEERRQAKEAAESKAAQEARDGAFRRMAAYPLLFDFKEHMVYLAAAGNLVHDKLITLFARTFGAKLVPLDAAETAGRIAQDTGHARSFDDVRPIHLVESPVGSTDDTSSFGEPDRSFLGREWLTWLWHELESGDGSIALTADGRRALPSEAAIVMEKAIQLDCDFHLTGRTMIYADGPSKAPEAKAALRAGKQPTRAGLLIGAGGEEYALTLDATNYQVRGLKLPDVDEPNPLIRLEERCRNLIHISAILDGLYATFLKDRFGGDYRTTAAKLRQWATGKQTPRQEQEEALRIAR